MNKYSENLWALQTTEGSFVLESTVFGASSINKDLPALYYSRQAAREALSALMGTTRGHQSTQGLHTPAKVVKASVSIKAA